MVEILALSDMLGLQALVGLVVAKIVQKSCHNFHRVRKPPVIYQLYFNLPTFAALPRMHSRGFKLSPASLQVQFNGS